MKVVICDIDGTLADCRHRSHHVSNGQHDWDAFFATMDDDKVVEPVKELLEYIESASSYMSPPERTEIFITTGRNEKFRSRTETWLNANWIPYDELLMRPDGDMRADHIVKKEMLDWIRSQGHEIVFVIDDRQSVVDMWRENGLCCLQVKADDPKWFPSTAILTIMVGPAGAGKSSWLRGDWIVQPYGRGSAKGLGIHPTHVLEADQFRQDLLGDFRAREQGDLIFNTMHEIAVKRLERGLPTVLDATHIRRKNRMTAAKIVPETVPVRYVVINRPMKEKLHDGGWRNAPELGNFMEKHEETFKMNLKDILKGDDLPNVEVIDLRHIPIEVM